MITRSKLQEMVKKVWDTQCLEVDYDGSAIYSITLEYIDEDGDEIDYHECLFLSTDGYDDVDDLEHSQEYYEMLEEMTDLMYKFILKEEIETFKLS